jgi:hypothetical protein
VGAFQVRDSDAASALPAPAAMNAVSTSTTIRSREWEINAVAAPV